MKKDSNSSKVGKTEEIIFLLSLSHYFSLHIHVTNHESTEEKLIVSTRAKKQIYCQYDDTGYETSHSFRSTTPATSIFKFICSAPHIPRQ